MQTQSSYNIMKKEKEEIYEYVVSKISEVYNFHTNDPDKLLEFRELIYNIIILYDKAKKIKDLGYGEQ